MAALTENQANALWDLWLSAQIREGYFALLCRRYQLLQKWLTAGSLVLSSGAFFLARHHRRSSKVRLDQACAHFVGGDSKRCFVGKQEREERDRLPGFAFPLACARHRLRKTLERCLRRRRIGKIRRASSSRGGNIQVEHRDAAEKQVVVQGSSERSDAPLRGRRLSADQEASYRTYRSRFRNRPNRRYPSRRHRSGGSNPVDCEPRPNQTRLA